MILPDFNSPNPWLATRTRTGAEYDAPYFEREEMGEDIHGEANLVEKLLREQYEPVHKDNPLRVLDGGCGTGRMGIELARRGFDIVGVDLDPVMLDQARAKAPNIEWYLADLAAIQLDGKFDLIALAGNVMIFLTPNTEQAVLTNLSRHLQPNGLLLAAFELSPKSWTDMSWAKYDGLCQAAGLSLVERWSMWDQDAWVEGSGYVVALHKKGLTSASSPSILS